MSELMHYGTPRHSGRYPWGSGDNPYQRTLSFLATVKEKKAAGMTEVEIARAAGLTTTQLRAKIHSASSEKRAADAAEALRLKNRGFSNTAIGERMGINESSVRSLLNPALKERANLTENTIKMLKSQIDSKLYLDIGHGVETHIGVSRTRLNHAASILKEQGYEIHYYKIPQLGNPGKFTSVKVLAAPGTPWRNAFDRPELIQNITDYSEDGGRSFLGLEPIRSVNQDRVMVRYGNEGGADKDGVIELRPGVPELHLGNAKYAQVRIGVNDSHYLKGMAVYSDDLPDGVDVIFNSNKNPTGNKLDAMKSMSEDSDNPFGATVRQRHFINDKGDRELSAINIVNEEGDWGKWSKTISSQVLSKQPPSLAKEQLNVAYELQKAEFDQINALTNPSVKARLLQPFADNCDAAAEHLKAAALPRQASYVILPFPDMPPNQVYAPKFKDGEKVVLIRHPHGGTFEIPELIVNNKAKTPRASLGNADDAVGIHPDVAKILSGADFDGDSVLVIPNDKGLIRTSRPLKQLENFDPKIAYPGYDGMRKYTHQYYQTQMGVVSNLITDMTIQGATNSEIARAVKHSMVVIDSEKHGLNIRQSYLDNGISQLSEKYQAGARGGASTIVSRASSEVRVNARTEGAYTGPISSRTGAPTKQYINPATGEKLFTPTNETYTTTNKSGKQITVPRTETSTRMREALLEGRGAHSLSSGTAIEKVYADHADKMYALGNQARQTLTNIKPTPSNPSARAVYAEEVSSLRSKLDVATSNSPLERQAQIQANSIVKLKKQANPDLTSAEIRRLSGQALSEARIRTGASKQQIEITPREWEAIQAGAVSQNTLTQILNNTNLDVVKQYATPRDSQPLSSAMKSRASMMLKSGYTQSEVAESLGISTSTLSKLIM